MTNPKLAEALDIMRTSPAYQNATPEQKASIEKIVRDAANGGPDLAVCASFGSFVARPLLVYYQVDPSMVQDVLNAFFNTLKSAIVADLIMSLYPDPNKAPDEALQIAEEASDIYKEHVKIYNNIAGAMIDDRIKAKKGNS